MVSWESSRESSLMAKKTIYTVYTKISKKLTNSSEKQTRMSHMPLKSVYIATLQPMSSCGNGGVLVRQINNAYNQCNCGWCITRCTGVKEISFKRRASYMKLACVKDS